MGRIIAICEVKPPTKEEIQNRLTLYKKDLESCKKDLKHRYKNANSPGMPNANRILNTECRRRIAHYVPAIKELQWVLTGE